VIDKNALTLGELAIELKIHVEVVDDINNYQSLEADINKNSLAIAIGAAWVFSKKTVDLFNGRLLDFMGISLPRYRGGAHYTWQILAGNKKGACNLQIIYGGKESFHRGEIIKSSNYVFSDFARIPQDYFDEALIKEDEFLKEFINEVKKLKDFSITPLDETFSSYFPFLNSEKHAWINWSWNAKNISLFVCAFDEPYCGASTFLNGSRVYLKGCEVLEKEENFHPFHSGLVYRSSSSRVIIAVRGGTIAINKIINENGVNIIENVKEGSRLYTPQSLIESSLLFEAEYDSSGLKDV
jgi:methionyl-tRNA formyltransferase